MHIQSSRRLRFQFDDGPEICLVPGVPMEVPAALGEMLLAQAPAHLHVLPDPLDGQAHDQASPIRPGWFLVFEHDGTLCGGPNGGDVGRVWKSVRDANHRWRFYTHGGFRVAETAVLSVTQIDEAGQIRGAWQVSRHGLNGRSYREPLLPANRPPSTPAYVPNLNTCYSCGGQTFWLSIYGATICGTCHPPVNKELVEAWMQPGVTMMEGVVDCRRRELRDLSPAQQRDVMDAYSWSREELDALTTGIWSEAVWRSFWSAR